MGRVEEEIPGLAVVCDMEAGLEHLSWAGGTLRHVDLLLVVAEPQVKSLLTAARTIELSRGLRIASTAVVANRVRAGDLPRMERFAADHGVELAAVVPDDPAIRDADRAGVSPCDHSPASPAVAALDGLARRLDARFPSTSDPAAAGGTSVTATPLP